MNDPMGLNSLSKSGIMLQIWSPGLKTGQLDERDMRMYFQLGMTVAMDKPLIIVYKPGDLGTISESVRKIATHLIEMDEVGEWQELLAMALLESGIDNEKIRAFLAQLR